MWDVTSWRQYSPAAAGVAIAKNASAKNAVAGATVIFKSCFIFFSLFWFQPRNRHGMSVTLAPSAPEKSKRILSEAQ
jgi:hypothetical protein